MFVDDLGFVGEVVVLDGVAEPAGMIAAEEMMQPGPADLAFAGPDRRRRPGYYRRAGDREPWQSRKIREGASGVLRQRRSEPMSTPSDWWMDWAIWGAILLVFAIAGFLWLRRILERIRRSLRGEDVPPNLDGLD